MKKEHIIGMNMFRGIAAGLVFLYHFWTFFLLNTPFFGDSIFKAGHLGVDLFFVLSGLLVFLSASSYLNFFETDKKEKDKHDLIKNIFSFYKKRFWRIFPLAALFIMVVFIIKQDFSFFAWKDALVHLFFLQGFFSEFYHGIHPVMWTLTVEAVFYFFIPFFLLASKKNIKRAFWILGTLFVLNFCYRASLFFLFDNWTVSERIFYSEQFWGRFDQFGLGIILGIIWHFRDYFPSCAKKMSPFFMSIGSLGFIGTYVLFAYLGSHFREILFFQIFLHFFVAFFFSLFLHGYFFSSEKFKIQITPKWLLFLGEISYGIYLWHFPVQSFTQKLLFHEKIKNFGVENEIILGFFISLSITIFLSYLTYEYVEKKFSKVLSSP